MGHISSCNPFKLAIIATIIGLIISDDKDANELNLIGNFLIGVGGIIIIVASEKQSWQEQQEKKEHQGNTEKHIQELRRRIEELEKRI